MTSQWNWPGTRDQGAIWTDLHALPCWRLKFPSSKCKMVWKLWLKNSPTLNSYTDYSRCAQMLPDRLNTTRCAICCSESTSLVPLNGLEVEEQSTRISSPVYSGLQMLPIQTIMIGKFQSYWGYWTCPQDNSGAPRTWSHALWKWLL